MSLITYNANAGAGLAVPQAVSTATPLPVTLPGNVPITPPATGTPVTALGRAYESAPANATTVLGGVGAVGDDLDAIWIFPSSLNAMGAVQVKDGANVVWTFPAAQTLQNLAPIFVPLNLKSVAGAWSLTLGANGTALGSGKFT